MSQILDPSVQEVRRARGEALKRVRKASGLSARKLVERINARTGGSDITEHAIYAYESGRVQLSREVAERVAEVLKVPLGGLLVGDPDFAPPAPEAPAGDAERAVADERVADRDEMPPDAGRWSATRASLLARFAEAEPAATVLIRQLGARRFQLPDPVIFAASFELLDADLAAMASSPEAAWVNCQESDRWHEPLEELVAAAIALRDAAGEAWEKLSIAAATGRAAGACPKAVEELTAALGALQDAAGLVRQQVSGSGG